MRNSSLVECPRADNGPGLKSSTEAVDVAGNRGVVGERLEAVKGETGVLLECSEVRMPV